MLTPVLTAHTDTYRHVTMISVSGPIINREQAMSIRSTCLIGPQAYGLVINLSGVSLITEVGLDALREVARCTREAVRINTFMLDATSYLKAFVEKLSQMNGGRAFFTTPENLGDYVLVDFVEHRTQRRGASTHR